MKNKKLIIGIAIVAVILIAIIVAIVSAISAKNNRLYHLVITEKNWTAIDQYTVDVKELDVKKKDVADLSINWNDKITFEVTDVEEDRITIETSAELKTNGAEEAQTKFTIIKGTTTKLNTLSTDVGASFQIDLK